MRRPDMASGAVWGTWSTSCSTAWHKFKLPKMGLFRISFLSHIAVSKEDRVVESPQTFHYS